MAQKALIKATQKSLEKSIPHAMSVAVVTWADATTDASSQRRGDLLRDKSKAVADFFAFIGKGPEKVTPGDVKAWQEELESQDLSPATIYAKISRISSFYNWARKDSEMASILTHSPVDLARPKAPKSYQSESTKALGDKELESGFL